MSAGRGIAHSEMNASARRRPLRADVGSPDTEGIEPSYEQTDVSDDLATGGLVPVAGGPDQDAAVTIQQRDAALWAAQLRPARR